MAQQEKIKDHEQVLTLFVIGISIIAYAFPRFSDLLVYERHAILCGELWRILTAPFVHFSASHMFWDILVFGAAGFAIEAERYRGFWHFLLFTFDFIRLQPDVTSFLVTILARKRLIPFRTQKLSSSGRW